MRRKGVYVGIGLLLGLVLIGFWISFVEFDQLLDYLKVVKIPLVVLASLVYISAYFVRSIRWNLLLRSVKKLPIWETWLYSMGGNFINYMIPIRMGEVVKAWFVKKNYQQPIVSVLPSIFIDKTFDTIGIFFVILMLPFVTIKLSGAMVVLLSLLSVVFFLSLLVVFLAAFHKAMIEKILYFMFRWLPPKVNSKINEFTSMFIKGLNVFEHHWSILLYATLLTALGILLDGFYFFLLFRAFGNQLPFALILIGYTLINLSYALPQPPAQLGSNEWMMIIIFSIGFGLTSNAAGAIMAFAHILTALIMSVIGIAAISHSGINIIQLIFKGDNLYDQ
ncbi:MAG: hypothetical protein CVU48_07135 [Candidatus Cloacimonetes bacterium HGW-Cloacimonetes-1]|jgi:uncharacterized protein (TIRG00374 family)|nr:MAG: hypothetical protein CVU48_07135 [Candidatus Cloacimonetes bacterium HGW-Cloacimonetes-1]